MNFLEELEKTREPIQYQCPVCGGHLVGDGYTMVYHCENVDGPLYIEPDADPIYCELNQDV